MASNKEIRALLTLAGKVDPSLHQALMKATGETKKAAIESERLNKMAAAGNKIIKATAAAFTAGAVGMGYMASKTIDSADKLMLMKEQTGLSVEKLQELQYISSQVGGNLETLPQVAKALTAQMGEAAEGTKSAANAFSLLGVQVKDNKGNLRDQSVVFGETLQKLSAMPNITQRNLLANQLFGKSAKELLPMLNAGSGELAKLSAEANRLGIVMSTDTVNGLDTFGDTVSKMKQAGVGFLNQFIGRMAPQIQPLLDKLVDRGPEIGGKVAVGFEKCSKAIGWMSDHAEILLPLVTGLGASLVALNAINTVTALMNAWKATTFAQTWAQEGLNIALKNNPIGLWVTGIGLAVAAGVYLYRNWETVSAKAVELWEAAETYMPWLKFVVGPIGMAIDAGRYLIQNWDEIMAKAQQMYDKVQKFVAPIANVLKGPGTAGAAYQSARDKDEPYRKFAGGGIANRASIFGEAGPEMAIPLKRTPRSVALLNQTAQILGTSGSGSVVYSIPISITVEGNAEPNMVQSMVSAVEAVVERVLEEKARVAYG